MALSEVVKAAGNLAGLKRGALADALGINSQSLTNKYTRDSFSGLDLVKIAEACGYRLAFVDDQGKAVIAFPKINENKDC